MKKLLIGLTIGAITGAIAYKKLEENRIPEKALKTAQDKLCDD